MGDACRRQQAALVLLQVVQAVPPPPRRPAAPLHGPPDRLNRTNHPRADVSPWLDVAIDWDATLAFRRHLWGLGLAVAEAMDTAQRGAGLAWPQALELVRRSAAEARATPGARIASGQDCCATRTGRSARNAMVAAEFGN